MPCLACTLPSLYVVPVVFGTAIPTSLYSLGNVFYTCTGIVLIRVYSKVYKYEKHFQKMYSDVGMAMPKTTETRCRDGSVQGRHVIQRLHN